MTKFLQNLKIGHFINNNPLLKGYGKAVGGVGKGVGKGISGVGKGAGSALKIGAKTVQGITKTLTSPFFMIAIGGASNQVMQAFGIDPGGIRNFLQGVVGFSFGSLSFVFLIIAVIAMFKFLSAQKSDKEKRRHNIKILIFNTLS